LLYELFNFESDEEYQALADPLNDKRKSRDDFAMSMVRHKFNAALRTKWFLLQCPIPEADATKDRLHLNFVNMQEDFSLYVGWMRVQDDSANPLKYFADVYDHIVRQFRPTEALLNVFL